MDGPNGDLHLDGDSPAIGAGIAVPGVTEDFDGSPRSDPPSLGAYAFHPPGSLSSDLSIAQSDHADPVASGVRLAHTITVSNNGPDPADGVTVTDVLPSGVVLLATDGCAEDPHDAPTCSLGWVPAGAAASSTLTVLLDPIATGTLTNEASVTSVNVETKPGDETFTETTNVITVPPGDANADLSLDAGDLAATIAAIDDLDLLLAGDPDCTQDDQVLPDDLECIAAAIHQDDR